MKQEIKDLIEYKELDIADYDTVWDLHDALDYDGALHELIDGMIDIYNYDLRVWAVDNYQYVDEAKDEGLISEECDFHKQIQAGQYLFYREKANEALEEVFDELKKELEQEEEETAQVV